MTHNLSGKLRQFDEHAERQAVEWKPWLKPLPMKTYRPFPLVPMLDTFPVCLLVEFAETFRDCLVSPSAVVMEYRRVRREFSDGMKRLAIVSWDLKAEHPHSHLGRFLQREYQIGRDLEKLEHSRVSELFEAMVACHATVWFVPLWRWGGSAIFICKPAGDASLTPLKEFNRELKRRRPHRPSWQRTYPPAVINRTMREVAQLSKARGSRVDLNSPRTTIDASGAKESRLIRT